MSWSAAASQSSTFMLTWTPPASGSASPSARTPGKPPPDSRTTAAIAWAASTSSEPQVDVERDQRPAGADDDAAGRAGRARPGPRSGASSPSASRRASSSVPPRRKYAGRPAAADLAVEEDRQRRARPRSARRAARRPRARAAMSPGAIGTSGTMSTAPIRGWAPRWRRRSIELAGARDRRRGATPRGRRRRPTSVKTERWWSASEWTSSSRARRPKRFADRRDDGGDRVPPRRSERTRAAAPRGESRIGAAWKAAGAAIAASPRCSGTTAVAAPARMRGFPLESRPVFEGHAGPGGVSARPGARSGRGRRAHDRGAAAPGRRSAAGSSSTRRRSTRRSTARR